MEISILGICTHWDSYTYVYVLKNAYVVVNTNKEVVFVRIYCFYVPKHTHEVGM